MEIRQRRRFERRDLGRPETHRRQNGLARRSYENRLEHKNIGDHVQVGVHRSTLQLRRENAETNQLREGNDRIEIHRNRPSQQRRRRRVGVQKRCLRPIQELGSQTRQAKEVALFLELFKTKTIII
mmetsp:Transcript_6580/g.7297  ORF Transcript_6580/g.7297 Transcript_6580/m.7297 type:complete len:126 (+) Transcript_6580:176-553(+)